MKPSLGALAIALASIATPSLAQLSKPIPQQPPERPTGPPFSMTDREVIGAAPLGGAGVVWLHRTVRGTLYEDIEIEGEVTLYYLKLANGQLLYEYDRQTPEVKRLNDLSCERIGSLPPTRNRTFTVTGNTIPLNCDRSEADYQRLEKKIGRPVRREQ